MISIFKNLKSNKLNRGMSMVELIVVLSIFAAMSTVAIFNFGNFQGKIDIKNLASDIALKTVQAQKAAVSGILPPKAQYDLINKVIWKPTYGVYFNSSSALDVDGIAWNKKFYYFTDINSNNLFTDSTCPVGGECLDKVSITKGNYISNLAVFYVGDPPTTTTLDDLTVTFVRPNLKAELRSTTTNLTIATVSYVEITISSPRTETAKIRIYPSGRIQVK